MSPAAVDWRALLSQEGALKIVRMVHRRFGAGLGVADGAGGLVAGSPDLVECARAAAAAAGLRSRCSAHGRAETVVPLLVDGVRAGSLFAGGAEASQLDLLGDLLELLADELLRALPNASHDAPSDVVPRPRYEGMVGHGARMQELYRLLDKVVESDSTVLIQGENGTGKELIARAVHFNSARAASGRFVAQNCSAFNDNLLDSELFGHKRGAFTGAVSDKQGLFEVADRGTFFLDEIGDMSPVLQVKVLRVLQEGTFTPVGDTQVRRVDVRILAATHRDLGKMVERGEFREDLYYRVNVIGVTVPPLRERLEDLPALADYFLLQRAKGRRRQAKRLSEGSLERMLAYPWPGNVRELENEIERLVVLAGDEKIISEELLSPRLRAAVAESVPRPARSRSLDDAVNALERELILDALRRSHWNKTRAAKELQISRRNLIRKVAKYQLERRGAG